MSCDGSPLPCGAGGSGRPWTERGPEDWQRCEVHQVKVRSKQVPAVQKNEGQTGSPCLDKAVLAQRWGRFTIEAE